MRQEPRTASYPATGRCRSVLLLWVVCLPFLVTGCASTREAPEPEPEPPPPPVSAPEETIDEPAPPPPVVAEPEPEPEPVPVEPEHGRVAIVLSNRSPAYENVAVELGNLLERYLLYNLADKSLSPQAVFSGIADSDAKVVIAIGLQAAQQAMALSTLPVVFCQVFNIDVSGSDVPVKGVASIPPLSPQVRAWKQLNPNLAAIGAIIGEGHEDLVAEAQVAAAENGVTLHLRTATSDRETLYMFNRMAPDIDGFWLFPDNRVLSVAILKEMLNYASRHEVQIAVFNPALLALGASLSISSVDTDIAVTALEVADRIINGELDAIPARTPLHQLDVRSASGGTAAKGTQ
ncbi:MAG TPA: ABC transporter substrate binding protein [Woeseiaceae bacterium]|nr:ABC transporter substrate binding protein [Woeseiaceae bacterium]